MTTACRLWARACAATCWSSLPPSPSPSPSSSRPSPPPPCAASSFSGVARFMTSRMWHELDWDERHAAHNLGSEQADWDVGNMHESVAKLRWAELTDMQLGTHSSSDTRKPPGTKREREATNEARTLRWASFESAMPYNPVEVRYVWLLGLGWVVWE